VKFKNMNGSGQDSYFGWCRGWAERYDRFDTRRLEMYEMRGLEIKYSIGVEYRSCSWCYHLSRQG
jgi:hypothetical protein